MINQNSLQHSEVTFRGVSAQTTQAIMESYLSWRRRRIKPSTFMAAGYTLSVKYESETKSAFWHSRGKSYYFEVMGQNQLIRISDHWSCTFGSFPRSRKFNCGKIGSCYWPLKDAEKIMMRLPGEKYETALCGGIVDLNKIVEPQQSLKAIVEFDAGTSYIRRAFKDLATAIDYAAQITGCEIPEDIRGSRNIRIGKAIVRLSLL